MAATDLTTAANLDKYGVRTFSRKYGALEEVTVILDDQEMFDGDPATFESADTIGIVKVLKGDCAIMGFQKILVASGEAAAMVFGITGGATDVFGAAIETDATADTLVGSTADESSICFTADDTLDVLFSDADVAEATGGTGRYQFTVYILRGSDTPNTYENYVGDPNIPPQA